ncbi:hypothetical protein Q3C01_17655 [Bradyrhizobium sp. UFLA05-109]
MLDLINWIREEGRSNDDLSTILEKYSVWRRRSSSRSVARIIFAHI